MNNPPLPPDEADRLAELEGLDLLYTPPEERFDRITRMAGRLFETPMALISLVANDVQWFKSRVGVDAAETPREIAFCAHAILGEEPLVVTDARQDSRFKDNPLVTGELGIRYYAGCPIRGPGGHRIGTLCVIDTRPRAAGDLDVPMLKDLASWVETELEVERLSEVQQDLARELEASQRKALIDPLTGLWNHGAILDLLNREWARSERARDPFAVLMLDLDHFKGINDTLGHQAGDAVLRAVADRLRAAMRRYDAIGRYGGEEFMVVASHCDRGAALEVGEKLRERVESEPIPAGNAELRVTVSVGLAVWEPGASRNPEALVSAADQALYRAKRAGRNRVIADCA